MSTPAHDLGSDLWGDDAWESCPYCLQRYTYELEVRCVDCDQPMCPVCAVHVRTRRETVCPHCRPEGGESGNEGA